MKRSLFATLALLVILSMVLAAQCPAPPEPTTAPVPTQAVQPTTPPKPTETPKPTTPPEEKVTIRLLSGAVGQELELAKKSADKYMAAHPNITIEVFDTPDAVQDRLGVYLQYFETKSPDADLYQIDVIWPGDLAEHLIDLNTYGAKAVAGEHFDAIIQNNTVDGRLVGIPWFTDAGLLFYRTDLLKEYGYDAPPKTWTELTTMAQKIQDGERAKGNTDFWGYVWQGNSYEGLTCDALEWIYANDGGTIISADKKITINNDKAIAAVDMAAAWVGTISPKGVTGYQEEDARKHWEAGNAAFMRNWPYAYSLGNKDESLVKGKFDVSALPFGDSGHGAATLGGWQIAVSKYSKYPDIAADVALFFASKDEQKMRAIEGSYNPTIKSLYQDADVCKASPFMCKLYDVFINAVARPSTATAPKYNEVSTAFFKAVHSVLTGDKTGKDALAELELDLQDITGYEAAAATTGPGTTEKVTVRLLSGAVGQELELAKKSAQKYMDKYPNVTIEVFDTPDAVQDRLGVYLQYFETKSPDADLYQIDVIWPGDLAEHLIDLNEYGAKAVAGEHFDAIIQNNTVDGKLVGIPWFTDAGLLFYRTDLLKEYGYDAPPKTWTELTTMAQKIQDGERAKGNTDFWGFVWQGNSYEGLTCDALEWIYSNGGGTIISADKKITINNDKAIAAVDMAAAWVGTISPKGVTGYQEEDARKHWEAGNAAFMRNWPYAYSLGNKDESLVKGKFDVSALPFGDSGHGAATLGGWQIAVSKYSKNPKVAADVALFFASKDEQKMRAIEGSYNPTIKSLYQDTEVCAASPFMCKLYDVFINAVARPSTATAPKYNEVSTAFFKAVHSVLTGDKEAKAALEELELDLQDLTSYEVGTP